ncbi:MAG: hypothetical protein ACON4M_07820 [Crocinitomicaceae bacterium]
MNTSFLRIKKAVAAFALGSLLATFAATPIALADNHPDWARGDDMGVGATQANRCEALAIALLNAGYESTEADAEAASNFADIEGQCLQNVGLGVQLGAINAEGKTEYNGDALVQRTEYVLMITRLLQDEMDARIAAGEEVADLSEAHTAELAASTHSGWDTKVFSTDAEGNEVELDMFQVWARSIHFDLIKGENNGEFLNPEGALNGFQAATVADRAAESFELTAEYSSTSSEESMDEEPDSEEEATPEVEAEGGDLTVTLSDNSPESATVYGDEGDAAVTNTPVVAMFTLSASDEDVAVDSLVLKTFETKSVISDLAIYSSEGVRLSKAKSPNSDNEASITLLDTLNIEAGSSVEVAVKASILAAATAEGSFSVELMEVSDSNAGSVDIMNAKSAVHTVEKADLATLTFDSTSSPDVNLGERGVEVYDFTIDVDNEDVVMNGLTVKQTGSVDNSDLSGFELYIQGEMVSEGIVSDKYVAFNFDSSMELTEDFGEYRAQIKANVLAGAGETIQFDIESELDVDARSENLSAGVATNKAAMAGNSTTIEAGELTLVALDAENDETTYDRDDVVLAEFMVTPTTGDNLELQEIEFIVTDTAAADEPETYLDNVKVYVGKERGKGTPEDLTEDDNGDNNIANDNVDKGARYTNRDLTFSLSEGVTYYVTLKADIIDDANAADMKLEASMTSIGGAQGSAGFFVEEQTDDEAVTDITPSSITFDAIDIVAAGAQVTATPQSDITGIVGATYNAFEFQIDTTAVSDLTFEEMVFELNDTNVIADTTDISQVVLYSGEEVLGSTSDIAAGLVTFDLNHTIEADTVENFMVEVTLVDDDNNAASVYEVEFYTAIARDSYNKTVDLTNAANAVIAGGANTVNTTRAITAATAGELTISVDNTLNGVNKPKLVLAGQETPYVAAFELSATNEPITVEDLTLTEHEGDDLSASIASLHLYNAEGELLASEDVQDADTAVSFEAVDIVVSNTESTVLYVSATTHAVGFEKLGAESGANAATLDVSDLNKSYSLYLTVDAASGKSDIAAGDINGEDAQGGANGAVSTLESNFFAVAAVNATFDFVNSIEGSSEALSSSLSNTSTAAIVKVQAPAFSNTQSTSNDRLKLELEDFVFTVEQNAFDSNADGDVDKGTVITGATLQRYEGSDDTIAAALGEQGITVDAEDVDATLSFDLGGFTSDQFIESGQTVYYILEVSVTRDTTVDNDDSIRVSMIDIDDNDAGLGAGAIVFKSDETANNFSFVPVQTKSLLRAPTIGE